MPVLPWILLLPEHFLWTHASHFLATSPTFLSRPTSNATFFFRTSLNILTHVDYSCLKFLKPPSIHYLSFHGDSLVCYCLWCVSSSLWDGVGRPRVWGGGRGRALKLVAEGNDNGDLLGRIILPLSFLSELFLKAEKMTNWEFLRGWWFLQVLLLSSLFILATLKISISGHDHWQCFIRLTSCLNALEILAHLIH